METVENNEENVRDKIVKNCKYLWKTVQFIFLNYIKIVNKKLTKNVKKNSKEQWKAVKQDTIQKQ